MPRPTAVIPIVVVIVHMVVVPMIRPVTAVPWATWTNSPARPIQSPARPVDPNIDIVADVDVVPDISSAQDRSIAAPRTHGAIAPAEDRSVPTAAGSFRSVATAGQSRAIASAEDRPVPAAGSFRSVAAAGKSRTITRPTAGTCGPITPADIAGKCGGPSSSTRPVGQAGPVGRARGGARGGPLAARAGTLCQTRAITR